MSVKSRIGALLLAGGGATAVASSLAPQTAYAASLGWSVNGMLQNSNVTGAGLDITNINQQSFANAVTTITTFLLGMAIVAVVLRVVLTAIDRMVFSSRIGNGPRGGGPGGGMGRGGGDDDGVLTKIPLIGAYPSNVPWKTVFGNFAKNLAIVIGAWFLINLIAGVVQFAFTMLGVS